MEEFVRALREPRATECPIADPVHLAAVAAAVTESATSRRAESPLLTTRWRRRIMIDTFLSTLLGKLVLGSAAVAVAASGAAAAGVLPDPAQQAASDALSNVGIEIPAPEDLEEVGGERVSPDLPEDASDTAKAVTGAVFEGDPADGRDFGDAVAGTASGGAAGAPELPGLPDEAELPELPEQADAAQEQRP